MSLNLKRSLSRLRVVPHFSSGIVERAKRERAWGDFHARLRLARSTISEEKWGTTRSLVSQMFRWIIVNCVKYNN